MRCSLKAKPVPHICFDWLNALIEFGLEDSTTDELIEYMKYSYVNLIAVGDSNQYV